MNPSSSFSLPCTSSSYMMTMTMLTKMMMVMTLASTALIGSLAHSSPLIKRAYTESFDDEQSVGRADLSMSMSLWVNFSFSVLKCEEREGM